MISHQRRGRSIRVRARWSSLRIAMACLLAAAVGGCAVSPLPESDPGFAAVEEIQSLAGCYRNRGDGDDPRYLSAVIWPSQALTHADIVAIKVEFEGPRGLRVSALTSAGIARQALFLEGEDFHLTSGRIEVKADTTASLAYPAGNVFIGAIHETQALGLDPRGDARLQEGAAFAGTAFLVIPMAGDVQDAFRFPRSPELCKTPQ